MKKTLLFLAFLVVFMVFSIATTGIDKGKIDPSSIPAEISSILAPDKVEQAIVFSDFKDSWYFFSNIFDMLLLGGILWLGFSRHIKSASEKLVERLHRQRSPMVFTALLFLLVALALTFLTATDKRLVAGGSIVMATLWAVIGMFVGKSRKFAVQVIYILIFLVTLTIIGIPFTYYRDFIVEHHFNLSTETFGEWAATAIRGGYVVALFMVVLIPFAYWGISRRPKDWWLWVGIAAIPIMISAFVIVPVFIDPMFNKYEPLQDQVLAERILGMAKQAGIEGGRVYQVDMSGETEKINAFVTGLFGSKRIVLWDTTIKKMTADEIAFVMAHEMGHYVLHHVWIFVGFFGVMFLIVLFIIYKTVGWIIGRNGERFGFSSVSDIASLPLLTLMLSVLLFIADPLTNGFSRRFERDADKFGLNITRDNANAVGAFVKLANENLSNPRPSAFIEFWLYDHPALKRRIDFCKSYLPGSE